MLHLYGSDSKLKISSKNYFSEWSPDFGGFLRYIVRYNSSVISSAPTVSVAPRDPSYSISYASPPLYTCTTVLPVMTASCPSRTPPLCSTHGDGCGFGAYVQVPSTSLIRTLRRTGSTEPTTPVTDNSSPSSRSLTLLTGRQYRTVSGMLCGIYKLR